MTDIVEKSVETLGLTEREAYGVFNEKLIHLKLGRAVKDLRHTNGKPCVYTREEQRIFDSEEKAEAYFEKMVEKHGLEELK